MKKLLSTLVAALAVISFTGVVFAADSANVHPFESSPKKGQAQPAKKRTKHHPKHKGHHKGSAGVKKETAPAAPAPAPAPSPAAAPPAGK